MSVTRRMAVFKIASTVAFPVIVVIGEGRFATFSSHAALIAVALVTIALARVALFAKENVSSGEREDRGNRWLPIAFGAIGLAVAYLPTLADRQDPWTLDGDALRWFALRSSCSAARCGTRRSSRRRRVFLTALLVPPLARACAPRRRCSACASAPNRGLSRPRLAAPFPASIDGAV